MAFKLISAEDIKALTKGDFGPDFDYLLNDIIIPAIGARFASYCKRPDFDKKVRTEYLSPRRNQTEILLSSPPIATSPAIQLWEDTAFPRVYGTDTELVNGEDFIVHEARGAIEKVAGLWARGPKTIKVTYSGGYLTADFEGVPGDLRFAAISQAKILFDRREEYGITGRTLEGGSISLNTVLILPRQVTLLLDQYDPYRTAV